MEDKIQEDRGSNMDVDKLIEERERLERLFKDRFTKTITVMFTDLKGSTAIAETHGDFASRSLIKQHNDIVFPLVAKHGGTLVKTMGDGTMSYFADPQGAVRAAAEIQKGIDAFNLQKKIAIPILMRVGIHTGQGIVERNDIFGDVVNVASRIEGQASPGEIFLSEEAYAALADKTEIHCGFAKEAALKGKKEPVKLYKAYWNPSEVEKAAPAAKPSETAPAETKTPLALKLAVPAAIVLLAALAFLKLSGSSSDSEKRTETQSVTLPGAASR